MGCWLGFTLIELLVVMTIIAIAASAVSLLSSSNTPANSWIRKRSVYWPLSLVSDEAIFDGREVGVEFFQIITGFLSGSSRIRWMQWLDLI